LTILTQNRVARLEWLIALLLAFYAAAALGQNDSNPPASIRGTVRNAHREPVADAAVTLRTDSHAPAKTVRTDKQGQFQFTALAPGAYTIEARSSASVAAYGPLTLQPHESKAVDLTLMPSSQDAAFYEQPTFAEAGVTQPSGGSHGSDPVRRQTADLTRATAALTNHADRSNNPAEAALFDQGSQQLSRAAYAAAAEIFTRGIAAFPDSARMHMGLGVAEFARGGYTQAAQEICRASDLDPANPTPSMFLGRMADLEEFRSPDVSTRLARFARLYPENAWANYYAGVAAWHDRKNQLDSEAYAHATALLNKAVALDPKQSLAWLELGSLFESRGQNEQAAAALEKSIAIDPSLAEAHYRLAQVDRRLGKTDEAKRELELHQQLQQAAASASTPQQTAVQQFVDAVKQAQTAPGSH
jgi:tetratricopeptide (TPR) repeat protein